MLVRTSVFATVVFAATTILQAGSPLAQAPEEPKNLKVLPKDMSRREVVSLMRSFSQALGVRCVECHVSTKPGSERPDDLDFASDKRPDKETARKMMKMVGSVNDQIGQMGLKDAVQVRCVTCHHGVKRPETLSATLTRSVNEKGVPAAIERYRELRDRYHGTAAYDFSPQSLNEVAGGLAEKQDFDGAIQLLRLNLEFSPKDAVTYLTLGQVQLAKGDRAAAIASFEKTLELDPENRWARTQLERAKSGR
jgi:hypothetical protein